ncbi:uncharacterized protein G2W53_014391 [Senna tora]|uniref:Uncharacterized protein n=1 Tax=Senna tora TaxID=362788 RepID=A0A834WT66_9FABA|nr:uncharacterized protein G2W53_014391 [Senna tora]
MGLMMTWKNPSGFNARMGLVIACKQKIDRRSSAIPDSNTAL